MSQGRHGIKVLGLSLLAALGLMAFAASAQATGEFLIEEGGVKKTFTEHKIAEESVSGTVGEGLLLVPGLPLTIKCTGGTFSGTVLLGGTAHASILFSGCEQPGVGACKTFETKAKMETNLTADKGFISASGLGELLLMGTAPNNKHYLLVESANFTTIYWTKLCASALETVVGGSTVFELPIALTPSVTQQIKIIPQAELESLFKANAKVEPKDTLFYGTQVAWLDEITGPATAAFIGALKGKLWGAH